MQIQENKGRESQNLSQKSETPMHQEHHQTSLQKRLSPSRDCPELQEGFKKENDQSIQNNGGKEPAFQEFIISGDKGDSEEEEIQEADPNQQANKLRKNSKDTESHKSSKHINSVEEDSLSEVSEDDQAQQVLPQLEDNLALTATLEKYEVADVDGSDDDSDDAESNRSLWNEYKALEEKKKKEDNSVSKGNQSENDEEIDELFEDDGSGIISGAEENLDLSRLQDL